MLTVLIYSGAGLAGLILIATIGLFLVIRQIKKQMSVLPPTSLHVNLDPVHRAIEGIPNKVLQSIVSKNNNYRGDLGELVSFLKLGSIYDRVIPINNLADFIGIKFPTETEEGRIDFIDVKTGKASLSKDQKILKKLIEDKKINFVKFRIDINTGTDSGDTQS